MLNLSLKSLSKVHKDNFPATSILSAMGTYNYRLAKFLVLLLQPLTTNQLTVTESVSFVKEISSFPNHLVYMASFDVFSLYSLMFRSMRSLTFALILSLRIVTLLNILDVNLTAVILGNFLRSL